MPSGRSRHDWCRGIAACLSLVAIIACDDSDPTFAPQSSVTSQCVMRLASDPAYDLVLTGAGGCGGTVRLALRVATGDPLDPVWTAAAEAPVRVEGRWQLGAAGATRELSVSTRGNVPVSFVGLEWTALDLGLRVDRMVHDGYQGSSYSGIEPIPPLSADDHGTLAHAGDDENSQAEIPGVSWWWTAISDASGRGLVVGADGATVLKTYVGADGGAEHTRVRVVVGVTGDAITLNPGESRQLDGLFLTLGDVGSGLDAYAQRVASLHPAHNPQPPATPHRLLGGWGSWNVWYLTINASRLRDEAAWAHDHLVPVGLTDFLLDDGYEPYWGKWETNPSRWGSDDLRTLSQYEAALGLTPTLWLAPMYVSRVAPEFAEHPDWFVHTADGQIRIYSQLGDRVFGTLDISHPDARAFIIDQLQTLRASGYRNFKLDFLYAAAIEGIHQEPMTALESYQRWMQAIRNAVPDAHILGAGAPILPSVGWVDSMRTGSDAGFMQPPYQTPRYGFFAAQTRQTAVRSITDAWWAIDPDVILLRSNDITDVEAWTNIVAGALAGGNYLLGDGRQASDLRVAMALEPEILALHDGVAARPRDLMNETDPQLTPIPVNDPQGHTAVPHVWEKRAGSRRWLAVFGWLDDPYLTQFNFPQGAVEIIPPATAGAHAAIQPIEGNQSIQVARHGVRLFRW